MTLDGVRRDMQPLGDLFIAEAPILFPSSVAILLQYYYSIIQRLVNHLVILYLRFTVF